MSSCSGSSAMSNPDYDSSQGIIRFPPPMRDFHDFGFLICDDLDLSIEIQIQYNGTPNHVSEATIGKFKSDIPGFIHQFCGENEINFYIIETGIKFIFKSPLDDVIKYKLILNIQDLQVSKFTNDSYPKLTIKIVPDDNIYKFIKEYKSQKIDIKLTSENQITLDFSCVTKINDFSKDKIIQEIFQALDGKNIRHSGSPDPFIIYTDDITIIADILCKYNIHVSKPQKISLISASYVPGRTDFPDNSKRIQIMRELIDLSKKETDKNNLSIDKKILSLFKSLDNEEDKIFYKLSNITDEDNIITRIQKLETYKTHLESAIRIKEPELRVSETALRERETALREIETTLSELETILKERKTIERERGITLRKKHTALEEKKTALREREIALKKRNLEAKSIDKIREFVSLIRDSIQHFTEDVFQRIFNVMIPIQKIFIN